MAEQQRIVTPEQLVEGYSLLVEGFIVRLSYVIVRGLPNGNYVVQEPVPPESSPDRPPVIDAR